MKISDLKFIFKNNGRDTLVYTEENSKKEEVKNGETVTVAYSVLKNFDKAKDFELVSVETPKIETPKIETPKKK